MGAPLRLLIIEDSEDDCALIVRELKRGGYEPAFKRVDSQDALKPVLALQDWDLVISDFSMPQFSGSDALKMVRTTGSDAPFIFVSGTMGEDTAVEALKNGAQDYLVKTNLKRLVPAVQRELREAGERRERKRLEQHVQQLQKFEAIGRLAGGIAHDFNNAIGAIMGWAEIGCEEAEPGTRFHDRFERIHSQAVWAGKLTSQLLTFARRQVLQPRATNLNTSIDEGIKLLHRVIGEQIEVRVHKDQDLNITLVDPTQVEQAIMNLCLNARDAMSEGGILTLETRNVEIDEQYCRQHPSGRPGRYVMLSVSDTGAGMDKETLDQVFEPFFTTKELGRGTGLGLATVYGVVKQHEGFVYAYSEPGNGTVFRLYFPVVIGATETRAVKREEPPQKGTGTILLADDYEALRESTRAMLEELGYEVMCAQDGLEAVQLFMMNADKIDLVLLDVVLPAHSGPEVYAQISALRPGTPVIFASGYTAENALLKSAIQKGVAILEKPFRMSSLSRAIRDALAPEAPGL
jgi:two-component system, cell cycle sensor histidine kinase and response regulator CckA